MRRARGFSLAELTVALALFGLFSTTALAALNLALGHWKLVSRKVDATASCRSVTSTISAELRQGVPNPHSKTGYRTLGKMAEPTAVLVPNPKQPAASELVFTEPEPSRYDPLAADWDEEDPRNYRRVRYYVSGGIVRREVRTFQENGQVDQVRDDVVADTDGAALRVTRLEPDLFELQVSCTSGDDSARLGTEIFVMGR